MEQSLNQLWTVCIWFFGISATITIAMFGWIMKIHSRISICETIEKDIRKMSEDVEAVKNALIGGYDKKGLITRQSDLERRVEELEKAK